MIKLLNATALSQQKLKPNTKELAQNHQEISTKEIVNFRKRLLLCTKIKQNFNMLNIRVFTKNTERLFAFL